MVEETFGLSRQLNGNIAWTDQFAATVHEDFGDAVNALSGQMDISSLKLQQVAAVIQETLPTAEQIQLQIEIAEEEYRISLSEKKDR